MATYYKTYRQDYRVADDSLAKYELYAGEDEMPDFDHSLQPVATSATLPFDWTPDLPDSGSTTQLYLVVRRRNKYDMLSHNRYPTIIEIDELGDEVLGPLTNPEIENIADGATGAIIVHARYPWGIDRDPADQWEIYVKQGVDPDPDVDNPTAVEAFGRFGIDYRLHKTISGLTPGATYHVLVAVIRSDDSDGGRGESAVSQHTTAEAVDLDPDDAEIL